MALCPKQSVSIYNTNIFNLDTRNTFFTARAIIHRNDLPRPW